MVLDFDDIALRLSAAAVMGVLIGINRDLQNKPIGARTLGLVGLGAATVAVAGIQFPGMAENPDAASRVVQGIIQGVMTGISFIGAGVILRDARTQNGGRADHRCNRVGHRGARHRLRARRMAQRRDCGPGHAGAAGGRALDRERAGEGKEVT